MAFGTRLKGLGALVGLVLAATAAQPPAALDGAGGAALAQQAPGSVLRIRIGSDVTSFDPHRPSTIENTSFSVHVYDGLFGYNLRTMTIEPRLVREYNVSEDGLTYTFDLRDGAVWSDGTPVTAGDFVFSLRRILAPETAAQYAFLLYPILNAEAANTGAGPVEDIGVRAIDDDTLEFTLAAPTPYFLELLTHYTAFPVPQHVVEAHGESWLRPENIEVNGPYKLVEWIPNTSIHVTKNDLFYDAANVSIAEVYYYAGEDRSAALRQYRAGEVDLVHDFASEDWEMMKAEEPEAIHIAPYLGIYYFAINHNDPALADPRVRRALNLATNRRAITDLVLGTGELPASSFAPPLPGYEPARAPWADADPDAALAEAVRLMEEAGFSAQNPLQLVIRYNTSANHQRVSVALAAMWEPIHIRASLFNTDVAVHYEDLEQNDFQVGRAGWIADYPDAQNFLTLLETAAGDFNYGRWSNAEYDALMREAALTTDLKARAEILQQAEQIALDADANIPIYYYVSKNIVGPQVVGFVPNAKDIHRTRWMSIDESLRRR